jgi:hypothetical protein
MPQASDEIPAASSARLANERPSTSPPKAGVFNFSLVLGPALIQASLMQPLRLAATARTIPAATLPPPPHSNAYVAGNQVCRAAAVQIRIPPPPLQPAAMAERRRRRRRLRRRRRPSSLRRSVTALRRRSSRRPPRRRVAAPPPEWRTRSTTTGRTGSRAPDSIMIILT